MKGKKHKPEQIIRKLREADAILSADKSIGQVCQVLEISEQTYHRWRSQYGGMKAEEASYQTPAEFAGIRKWGEGQPQRRCNSPNYTHPK